jgi:hypothetical protein
MILREMLLIVIAIQVSACQLSAPQSKESELGKVDRTTTGQLVKRLQIDPALAGRDKAECSNWSYDERFLKADMAAMRPATIEEWGRKCYQYACSVILTEKKDGKERIFEVNAGGWITIKTADLGTNIYISEEKRQRFLATCNCCEEESR